MSELGRKLNTEEYIAWIGRVSLIDKILFLFSGTVTVAIISGEGSLFIHRGDLRKDSV